MECGHPFLTAGEITRFWRVRHSRPYGVEVDVGHAGQDRSFILKFLALETPLPKTTGTTIFVVGAAGDGLIETTHEPAEVGESAPTNP